MNYIKTNTLDTNIINQIIDFANKNDYEPFWADELCGEFNHFHYITENGQLLSFIGIMPTSENSIEITGFTAPSFRHQGHFSRLLKEALAEISATNLSIYCEEKLTYTFTNVRHAYDNYMMILDSKNRETYESGDEILEYCYEYETFTELIYVLVENSIPLGLLKIHLMGDSACIHHVAIRKPFRGLGYGKRLLNGALKIFFKENDYDIVLHVTSNNTAAVNLYKSAGFILLESLEYYGIDYLP